MKNNEILKAAFKKHFEEQYPYVPNAEEKFDWSFTSEYHFEQKMEKLIYSHKKSYWKYVNSIGKKVAIIFIALTVMFSTAMTVNAFREPVVDFIVKTYQKFSSFFVNQDSAIEINENLSKTIKVQMCPEKIPDGFTVSERFKDNYLSIITWNNKTKETIEFYQFTSSTAMNINTENVDLNQKQLNDMIIYYYTQDDITSYIWYENGYVFSLNTPYYFKFNEIEEIIKSVK